MQSRFLVVALMVVCVALGGVGVSLLELKDAKAGGVPRNRDAKRVRSFYGQGNGGQSTIVIDGAPGNSGFIITDIAFASDDTIEFHHFILELKEEKEVKLSGAFTVGETLATNGAPVSYHFESGIFISSGARLLAKPRGRGGESRFQVTVSGYELN